MFRRFYVTTLTVPVWMVALWFASTSLLWGQNTTVQLPTFGISIDADGVLSVKQFPDPGGRLHAARLAEARAGQAADLFRSSKLRKVSLVRLEQAVAAGLAAGRPLDDELKYLAGLQRLQYVFCYPDQHDIVIGGPAEGFVDDGSGRVVGVTTGRPVLRLDDLVVALRAFAPGTRDRPFIGCTISPDPAGLARLQKFQSTIPRTIAQSQRAFMAARIAQGMRESLGMANIQVFGISDRTHFAQTMLEADYRMKLIGVGLERPPVSMATFIDALKLSRNATLQRWWFTPDYDCVRVTNDRLGMELVGQGVQLQGEDKLIGPDGALAATGAPPNKASDLFTSSFTRKYPEIAARSPVYAELRNLIDMLVAAAFLRQEDWYGRIDWKLRALGDERTFPVATLPPPKNVACVSNVVWKGNRLFSPAGGGVSIRPDQALNSDRIMLDEQGTLTQQRQAIGRASADRWWWD